MIRIETEHFRLNRILLLAIGLWPYERSPLVKIQSISCFVILLASIVFQITAFWTPECTFDVAIKILSCVLFFTLGAIKYTSFTVNSNSVRYLLEHLKQICDELRDKKEIDIMKQCGSNATRYTARIMLITLVCMCCATLLPISPVLLDIVLPLNESRPRIALPIVICYFIDQDKYFNLILLHLLAAVCIQAIAIIGTGTMIISYFKHVCGMFNIVRYRIQQAIATEKSKMYSFEKKSAMCKRIADGVDIHRTAMESCTYLISNFEGLFFFLVAFGVTSLSLNLFLVFRTAVYENNVTELLVHLTIVVVILLYMVLGNYAVQDITDHYDDVFTTVYNVQWYKSPIEIQKMILFLLQRGTKSFNLILGGIYVPSVESAGKLISTSISYFTVLYSTR